VKREKRKLSSNILDEHRCKILYKTLPNRIQQHMKKIRNQDQVGFIPEMQGWFHIQINKQDTSHQHNEGKMVLSIFKYT
jgi:hypothetical protein